MYFTSSGIIAAEFSVNVIITEIPHLSIAKRKLTAVCQKTVHICMKNKNKRRRLLFFPLAAIILTAIIRIALDSSLAVRVYEITSDKLSSEHTFVLITDHHSTKYGERQSELIRAVREQDPEAVFLAGDIADDARGIEETEYLVRALAEEYPVYYTAGNHERWVEYSSDVVSLIESFGASVTDGSGTFSLSLDDEITLCGISDPLFFSSGGFDESLNKLARDTESEKYRILLSHRPEFAEQYAALGFDLTLCGHAHGGQVRLPLVLNGLYSPGEGFFPKYAGGDYAFNENGKARHVIVSRGLMKNEYPRVFNRPELVVIRLRGADSGRISWK